MKKQNLPVWKLIASSKRDLTLRTEIDYFQTHFVSKSMIRDWQQPLLRISGHSQRLRDFVSWMSSAPVISANAKKGLEDLISPYVEILALLELRGKLYYAINVLKLVDCLDRERSDILYSPVDGGILQVRRSIFRTDRLLDVPIFKLPDDVG